MRSMVEGADAPSDPVQNLPATPPSSPSEAFGPTSPWRGRIRPFTTYSRFVLTMANPSSRFPIPEDFMNAPAKFPALATSRPTPRHDGWSPERRRIFLECVADGHTIEAACAHVGMSKASVYALRRRDAGFALAWSGAALRARDTVADVLMSRAIDGQVDTWTRADGTEVRRHRYDNRLALALLRRLDKLAAHPDTYDIKQPEEAAVRGVAHDFDAFLDLLENGNDGEGAADAAAIGAFVDARIRQLRLLRSTGRACKLDAIEDASGGDPVWFDHGDDEWRTNLPPPDDFDGEEDGRFGDADYARTLTAAEAEFMEARRREETKGLRADGMRRHASWFGPLESRAGAARRPADPYPHQAVAPKRRADGHASLCKPSNVSI